MTKIHRRRIQKWVDALRSGEFKQGRDKLRGDDGRYCCLGVACELFRRSTGHGKWVLDQCMGRHRFMDDWYELPAPVQEWLGITDEDGDLCSNPWIQVGGETVGVADANDKGLSFKKIANAIEREYLK